MFDKVLIETTQMDSEYTQHILKKIKYNKIIEIDSIEAIWGKVKKPYLHKRTNLNLFIGEKKGQLVKEAPDAYGLGKEKHFYFIHAYNCIYECQYCYLQGYFNTPDVVLFTNHHDIIKEIEILSREHENAWFHAGEFSDSLALSHITNDLPMYFDFFKKNPSLQLELRTKSANIRPLLQLDPSPNIHITFSLSSENSAKIYDKGCPGIKARLIAIEKLVKHGYKIGIHFDPIIFEDDFETTYENIILKLKEVLPASSLSYISIGVVRFTKDVFREVTKNYPTSKITKEPYIKSFDGKVRYNRPMRSWILNKVKNLLVEQDYDSKNIYMCMED